MELLVPETRPEDRVGKIDFEPPGNRGKRAPGHRNKLEERGRQTPTWQGWKGERVGVQELYFSALSTLSRLFGVHF